MFCWRSGLLWAADHAVDSRLLVGRCWHRHYIKPEGKVLHKKINPFYLSMLLQSSMYVRLPTLSNSGGRMQKSALIVGFRICSCVSSLKIGDPCEGRARAATRARITNPPSGWRQFKKEKNKMFNTQQDIVSKKVEN